ncbi:hypothetical protein CBI33_27885 [Rhodococcus erythropolis]|uniref:hypothetical protein n=1 Tax=Rhodococcus sp. 311R TaxID=1617904 RepID=UPI00067F6074|nr:hypothetical protein [Rhodococcus sp. 311R]OXM18033.1 hypothetical protein CBI33_27885 [Rhodococcus erythropolis]
MSAENMQVKRTGTGAFAAELAASGIDASMMQQMQHADTEPQRRELAEPLWTNTQVCTVDLHDWIKSGTHIDYDTADEPIEHRTPRLDGGNRCSAEASTDKPGCCWCGKFRKETTNSAAANTDTPPVTAA